MAEPITYKEFYNIVLNPFDDELARLSLFEKTRLLVINRLVALTQAGLLYWWFYQRLRKTEKWIQ